MTLVINDSRIVLHYRQLRDVRWIGLVEPREERSPIGAAAPLVSLRDVRRPAIWHTIREYDSGCDQLWKYDEVPTSESIRLVRGSSIRVRSSSKYGPTLPGTSAAYSWHGILMNFTQLLLCDVTAVRSYWSDMQLARLEIPSTSIHLNYHALDVQVILYCAVFTYAADLYSFHF